MLMDNRFRTVEDVRNPLLNRSIRFERVTLLTAQHKVPELITAALCLWQQVVESRIVELLEFLTAEFTVWKTFPELASVVSPLALSDLQR
tara:strand:+ start:51772 stop:52041 length:270 start_codon:yes stop_codon:yes gene_type:complete